MNCRDLAAVIYSQIVGISHHPRAVEEARHGGRPIVALHQAITATDDALIEFRRRYGKCDDPNCKEC